MTPRSRTPLAALADVREGEGRPVFLSAAFFFLVLAGYYVLRPLREAMGVAGGGDRLSLLFLGTLAGTLLLNPLFGALVSRKGRAVFVPVVYRVVIASLLAFHLLFRFAPEGSKKGIASAFFVWVSVFVLFATSLFWGVMVDVWRTEQGTRLFGIVGAGGTAGGVVGAALTAGLVKSLGPENMILVAALLFEAAARSARALVRTAGTAGAAERSAARAALAPGGEGDEPPGRGAWRGARLVFGSPYLLAICGFLLLYAVSSTFLYFEQARIVRAAFASSAERAAWFARVDLSVNLLTIGVQALLTARVLRLLGVGGTLATLPVLTAAGFAALWHSPSAGVLFFVQVARRSAEFALVRPARELLFSVVSREDKYASKTFVDTFVYRTGDAFGAVVDIALKAAQAGSAFLALAFLPVAALWVVLSAGLGRAQERRARG